MENNITKIEIKSNQIVITYHNNITKAIPYNIDNKNRLIELLNNNKNNYKYLKLRYKYESFIIILNSISQLTITIFSYIYSNSFLLKFLASFITINFTLINLLLLLYFHNSLKSIKSIEEIIKTQKLPKEDEYLSGKKVININPYIEQKQSIFKYHYLLEEETNNENEYMNNKILEFKRKGAVMK